MTTTRVAATYELSDHELRSIRALMDGAFAGSFSDDDWDHTIGGAHVIVELDGQLVAHAAVITPVLDVGGRTLRCGYVEGVATLPARERRGFGSLAVREVDVLIRQGFDLGALSTHSHTFYERLGWKRWRGPSYVRGGSRVLRTADEDDGLMVLLFGNTASLDLALPITCEARSGDDW